MRASVFHGFMSLTASFEGGYVTNFMYLDVFGYVTTAFGVLINSTTDAKRCPWFRSDGTPASASDVVIEWTRVHSRQDLRKAGGMVFRKITTLRLNRDGVELVVRRKLDEAVRAMSALFPEWPDWPADAQLFALSMCWAIGPAWHQKFPKCAAAMKRGDFLGAKDEAHIDETDNPGIIPRNSANELLLENAHAVQDLRLDHETLFWPKRVSGQPLAPVVEDAGPIVDWQIVHPPVPMGRHWEDDEDEPA